MAAFHPYVIQEVAALVGRRTELPPRVGWLAGTALRVKALDRGGCVCSTPRLLLLFSNFLRQKLGGLAPQTVSASEEQRLVPGEGMKWSVGGQMPKYSPCLPGLGQNLQLLQSVLLKGAL